MKILHLILASCFLFSFILCQEVSSCNEGTKSNLLAKGFHISKTSSHDRNSEGNTDLPHHDEHCLHSKVISQSKALVEFLESSSIEYDLYTFSYSPPSITNLKRPPSFKS